MPARVRIKIERWYGRAGRMKHDRGCRRVTSGLDTDQFGWVRTQSQIDEGVVSSMTILQLGSVSYSYGHLAHATRKKPWIAHPWIPERFGWSRDTGWGIGPFRTEKEAMRGLERWWLKRLGATEMLESYEESELREGRRS